jgi:1-deoxy-D-xylulose-5-phosphate reductoisomerase
MVAAAEAPGGHRRLTVLGATGSIGRSTLDLVARDPDRFSTAALVAGRDVAALAEAARRFRPDLAVLADPSGGDALEAALAGTGILTAAGPEAVIEAARHEADLVVAAIVGAAGLAPTMAAIEEGRDVALATKECLVLAGRLFMTRARQKGVRLLPVDSEHNAVFQCFGAAGRDGLRSITLTASGGPFRTWSIERMAAAAPADALKHPNWAMGPRITIDSATLMNKGFEVIEAHHLFDLAGDRIEVLVHPQSIVHGMATYADGTVIAALANPDMRTPLAHCLYHPGRGAAPTPALDLAALGALTFEAPDLGRFPALGLAYRALAAGGGATAALNAADEVAVAAFMAGRIGFLDIARVAEATLDAIERASLAGHPGSLEEATHIDRVGRRLASERVPGLAAMRG